MSSQICPNLSDNFEFCPKINVGTKLKIIRSVQTYPIILSCVPTLILVENIHNFGFVPDPPKPEIDNLGFVPDPPKPEIDNFGFVPDPPKPEIDNFGFVPDLLIPILLTTICHPKFIAQF